MKIDKRKPRHWFLLLQFMLASGLAVVMRPLISHRPAKQLIGLYGHKLNGNLLAIYKALEADENGPMPVFLTLDPEYSTELSRAGFRVIRAGTWKSVRFLAQAHAIISDHGLHSLGPFVSHYQAQGMKFYDVWHGIPFKGFDAKDFQLQHKYDEVWVASDLMKSIYLERYGFSPEQVFTTGYARTDRLIAPTESPADLRSAMGIPREGAVILFAPTWKQDTEGRSIYPFGCSPDEFLGALSRLAVANQATVLLRSHLNTGDIKGNLPPGVLALPSTRYPDTEGILLISDMLVCDWSSIAFDYLLLERPTIFLDVDAPFKKGFSLGPEYRFGPVATSLESMRRWIETSLTDPESYWKEFRQKHDRIRRDVYCGADDGNSTVRCKKRLVCASLHNHG